MLKTFIFIILNIIKNIILLINQSNFYLLKRYVYINIINKNYYHLINSNKSLLT